MTEHPITPPDGLVERLRSEAPHGIRDAGATRERHLAIAAYRAGADAELEACCEWMKSHFHGRKEWGDALRDARRPQPSLAEQALNAAKDMSDCMKDGMLPNRSSLETVCAALKRLQEMEKGNG